VASRSSSGSNASCSSAPAHAARRVGLDDGHRGGRGDPAEALLGVAQGALRGDPVGDVLGRAVDAQDLPARAELGADPRVDVDLAPVGPEHAMVGVARAAGREGGPELARDPLAILGLDERHVVLPVAGNVVEPDAEDAPQLLRPHRDPAPVRAPGARGGDVLGVGELGALTLELAPAGPGLRHVDEGAHDRVRGVLAQVPERTGVEGQPRDPPVGAMDADEPVELGLARLPSHAHGALGGRVGGTVVAHRTPRGVEPGAADELRGGSAEDPLGGGVRREDVEVAVEEDHALLQLLDDRAVTLLRAPQLALDAVLRAQLLGHELACVALAAYVLEQQEAERPREPEPEPEREPGRGRAGRARGERPRRHQGGREQREGDEDQEQLAVDARVECLGADHSPRFLDRYGGSL